MKTLVISKPIFNYILPLVDFPQDGDKFFIEKSIHTISSSGSIVACVLGRLGMDVSYTGMVGEDENGKKIVKILNDYKVDTQYVETSYTEKTLSSYKIYNSKSNNYTIIMENSLKSNLEKYKYEFIPDFIVMDDRDFNANLAALNNYSNAKTIFIGDKFTKESSIYCNRCNYILCDLQFASGATGIVNNLNKDKNIVALFQKFVDLYSSNLIIRLNNFDILYCVNDEVRLIKNVNPNLKNKGDLFFSILIFNIINGMNIENSIKLTNKIMLSSNNEIDLLNDIPSNDVIRNEFETMKKIISTNEQSINENQNVNNTTQNIVNNTVQSTNINVSNPNQSTNNLQIPSSIIQNSGTNMASVNQSVPVNQNNIVNGNITTQNKSNQQVASVSNKNVSVPNLNSRG